jgi:hypothetical protein
VTAQYLQSGPQQLPSASVPLFINHPIIPSYCNLIKSIGMFSYVKNRYLHFRRQFSNQKTKNSPSLTYDIPQSFMETGGSLLAHKIPLVLPIES